MSSMSFCLRIFDAALSLYIAGTSLKKPHDALHPLGDPQGELFLMYALQALEQKTPSRVSLKIGQKTNAGSIRSGRSE